MKQYCSKGTYGRAYRTKADDFRQINWNFPQFSKEARGLLALRTTIEREISWLKRDLKNGIAVETRQEECHCPCGQVSYLDAFGG